MKQSGGFSDEKALIDAVRSGDNEAFRILVEKYQDKIIRTSKGFVHNLSDAEDIAQDVFIEVYQSIAKFRGESELSTWIYRITINKSLNFLKAASRRRMISFFDYSESGKSSLSDDTVASQDYCPDERLKNAELAKAVKKAIDNLPSKQRTAFILSKYEDLSYKEIASVMNATVPSVESILFRAKTNLQKALLGFYKKNIL